MLKVTEMGVAGTRRISAQKNKVAFKEAATMAAPKPSFPMMKMNPPTPTQDTYMPQNAATLQRRGKGVLDFIPDSYIDDAIGAALVVVAGALTRGKFKNLSNLTETLQKGLNDLNTQVATHTSKIAEITTEAAPDVEKLISEGVTNGLNGIKKETNELLSVAHHAVDQAGNAISHAFSSTIGYVTEILNINGRNFRLASIEPRKQLSGQALENLKTQLHAEGAKRILGLSNSKLAQLPENGTIAFVTSESKDFGTTGGLGAVAKDVAENLGRILPNSPNQKVKPVVYMPIYTGDMANNGSIRKLYGLGSGKFAYREEGKNIALFDKVYEYATDVYTANGIVNEKVGVYRTNAFFDLELSDTQARYEKLPAEIKQAIHALQDVNIGSKTYQWDMANLPKNQFVEHDGIIYVKDKGKISAKRSVEMFLLDNHKFEINVAESNRNGLAKLYNNNTLSAGEAEKFLYYDKFIYDLWADTKKPPELAIPDALIGNDWHTGGLSALLRLYTPTSKVFGELDRATADKLYNMPQITLLHNGGLAGQAWESDANIDELINVLFGNKSKLIMENAYNNITAASKKAKTKLAPELYNGMLYGHSEGLMEKNPAVSPQMMALSYSDIIVPVSRGYTNELSTKPEFAAGKLDIYAARAKLGEYANPEILKEIARLNNIDIPEDVDLAQKTLIGITNGCDRSNNTLTQRIADDINNIIEVKDKSPLIIKPYREGENVLTWHQENKKAAITALKDSVEYAKSGNKDNPKRDLKIFNHSSINLDGVTEDTPVFVYSGRITDQKGLDILAESLVEFADKCDKDNPPVFYIQGSGSDFIRDNFLRVVNEKVRPKNQKLAQRVVLAEVFDAGKFNMTKVMTDFVLMPSWFEPCGLAHKEIGLFSGAITVATKTGGIADGLIPDVTVFSSEFKPRKTNNATAEEIAYNAKNYANKLLDAVKLYENKEKFDKSLTTMLHTDLDWASKDGAIYEYLNLLERLGVLSHETATASAKLVA